MSVDHDVLTGQALAAADGDRDAAAAFVRATQAEVWRLLAHLTDPQAAPDLTQETYVRAFRSLPKFRAAASARTWLLAIARRVAADHLRSRSRRPTEVADPDAGAQLVSPGADPAEPVAMAQLLGHLDQQRREAFVLTQVVGLSYEETSEVCRCPVGTIRSRVARARDDLIAALNESGHRASG